MHVLQIEPYDVIAIDTLKVSVPIRPVKDTRTFERGAYTEGDNALAYGGREGLAARPRTMPLERPPTITRRPPKWNAGGRYFYYIGRQFRKLADTSVMTHVIIFDTNCHIRHTCDHDTL